ncbi:MAG TPA: tRNA adenosine deaminase-associated protein [Marmoricola sp.]|nr:tRNA adenosine deaminase-associated protein [Marmoricola sp.]
MADDIDEVDDVDLAVVAYLDEGDWYVQELPEDALRSVDATAHELRRYPAETGAVAMISVDEDWLLIVRVLGSHVRVLLSDASAATDWSLARSAIDLLGLPVDEDDEQVPAGDLGIVADLGTPAQELGELLDDLDLYPEEILSEVATRAGFGAKFDDVAGLSNA